MKSERAISKSDVPSSDIIMYIENQASGHFPPPSLRTIRQPIAVWRKFWDERGGDPPRQRSHDTASANTHGLRTLFMRKHGRPCVAHALGFSLIACLTLILKGYL